MFVPVQLKAHAINYFKIIPNQDSKSHKSLLLAKTNLTLHENIQLPGHDTLRIYAQFKYFDYKVCAENGENCKMNSFSLDIREYKGSAGFPNSGAYIFYPTSPLKLEYFDPLGAEVNIGNHVTQVKIYSNTAMIILRFFMKTKHFTKDSIEIETFIRAIDHSFTPSEIVLIAKDFNIINNQVFYTDSNGLEIEERKFKRGNGGDESEDVTANYFPVNAFLYIEDPSTNHRMILNNDRSQGGSSQNTGEIELMIHRKALRDDHKGMDEGVSETGTQFWTKHYLTFDDNRSDAQRRIQFYSDQPPLLFFSDCEKTTFSEKSDDIVKYGSLLPEVEFVKVYLQPLNENSVLMRYHNLNQKDTLKVSIPVASTELSLSGNQEKKVMFENKLKWTNDEKMDFYDNLSEKLDVKPLQIRTFEVLKEKINSVKKDL